MSGPGGGPEAGGWPAGVPSVGRLIDALAATEPGPHADRLGGPVDGFTRLVGAPESVVARWGAARFDRLAARLFPGLDLARAVAAARVVVWLFLVDDHLDPGGPGDDPGYADRFERDAGTMLSGGVPEGGSAADPLLRTLGVLLDDPAPPRDGRWRDGYVAHLGAFVRAMAAEVRDRHAGRLPGVEEYVRARRRTSGWDLLVDVSAPRPQDRAVESSAAFARLRRTGGDLAFAVNDVLSLPKEIRAGERHNLVLVAARVHDWPLPEAIGYVDRWIGSALDAHLAAAADLRRTAVGAGISPQEAERCVRRVDVIVRGTVDWSMESGRYGMAPPAPAAGPPPGSSR